MRPPLAQKQRDVISRVATLPHRDPETAGTRDLTECGVILRVYRFLEPVDVVLSEPMSEPTRRADAETAMAVHHHHDIAANRRAHGGDVLDPAAQVGRIGIASKTPERIELQATVSGGGDLAGSCRDVTAAAFRVIPAVGISLDLGMHATTEQIVDGLPDCLSTNVPERELERGDRTVQDRAAARVLVAVHRLNESLDVERRGAKHVAGCHVIDRSGDGARLPLHRALAESGQSGVGVRSDQHEIVPLVTDEKHLDAVDSHAFLRRRLGALLRRSIHNLPA